MMEVPQLHGFGPAANRLLEAYNVLLKVSFHTILCINDRPSRDIYCMSLFPCTLRLAKCR